MKYLVLIILFSSCTIDGEIKNQANKDFYYKCVDFRDSTEWVGHTSDFGDARIGFGAASYINTIDTSGIRRKVYADNAVSWQKCEPMDSVGKNER